MDHGQLGHIFFRELFTVPLQERLHDPVCRITGVGAFASEIMGTMAPGQLVAVLEALCARQIQSQLDDPEDVVIASSVQCLHRAPLQQGALVTVYGWVIALSVRGTKFWVLASDEQEIVCEGTIGLTIVRRSQIQMKMQRKREAIDRRKLFATV